MLALILSLIFATSPANASKDKPTLFITFKQCKLMDVQTAKVGKRDLEAVNSDPLDLSCKSLNKDAFECNWLTKDGKPKGDFNLQKARQTRGQKFFEFQSDTGKTKLTISHEESSAVLFYEIDSPLSEDYFGIKMCVGTWK